MILLYQHNIPIYLYIILYIHLNRDIMKKKMISVRINRELLIKARKVAKIKGKTLTELIEEGLQYAIAKAN